MTAICALGIDPGGTSGLFLGWWRDGTLHKNLAWQVPMAATSKALREMLADAGTLLQLVQVEEFDARERSRKMRGFSASAMHKLIADLITITSQAGIAVVTRPPAPVKGWATDRRLREAGLHEITRGKPHARDAARHALYCAVRDLGLRDPLSTKTASEEDGCASSPGTG